MAQFTELQVRTALEVGPRVAGDGSIVNMRGDRQGAGVVTQLHGKYTEAAIRGKLFYSYVAAAAMSAPSTSAIGNIVWNPPSSGTVLALLKWNIIYKVTDADALAIDLCYSPQATTPTTVTAATTGCSRLGLNGTTTGVAKAYSIGTITTAAVPIYNLCHLTAAVNTVGEYKIEGDFEGSIIVPPGYLISLHSIADAAASGIGSTLMWEEIPE